MPPRRPSPDPSVSLTTAKIGLPKIIIEGNYSEDDVYNFDEIPKLKTLPLSQPEDGELEPQTMCRHSNEFQLGHHGSR